MAFFPRNSYITEDPTTSFTPLFRLLSDFDNYSRGTDRSLSSLQNASNMPSFTPKFDVKEVAGAYELHGELPGIEQKDIEIEFTDSQTLTVKGRTERSYQFGQPNKGAITVGRDEPAKLTEGEHGKKARVEDENEGNGETAVQTKQSQEVSQQQQSQDDGEKYWVSERSVGEFQRSFSFPVRVDQDGVTATMKNGVLSIVIPKAKKAASRKISIQ